MAKRKKKKVIYRNRPLNGGAIKQRIGNPSKNLSPQKITSLKKQRRRLYNQRYYWKNKLADLLAQKKSEKSLNAAKRRLASINSKIEAINKPLGIVFIQPIPEKKYQYPEKNVRIRGPVTHWEASDILDETLEKGFIKTYVIKDKTYKKKQEADIRRAFEMVVADALSTTKTPYVEFIFYDDIRMVVIKIYTSRT